MSALHAWHRETFTKLHPFERVVPAYSTTFGGSFPEVRHMVQLPKARTVVCSRIVSALSPEEWKLAQSAFDASHEGAALATTDAAERREHCELWLLHQLHEADHPEMPAPTELALEVVKEHHCHPARMAQHKARLVQFLTEDEPLHHPTVG